MQTSSGSVAGQQGSTETTHVLDATIDSRALRAENMHWHTVKPTADQIRRAPVGNLFHRIWKCGCDHLSEQRNKWARPADLRTTKECELQGHPGWERALMPMPTRPVRKKAQHETFHWVVKPEDGIIQGTIYTDGSALDGPSPGLMRCGWAFVAVDSEGNITASAYGLPPPMDRRHRRC